ncbi:unnamed protein product [Schistosoma curassoni]|uniref:EFhand_Ca_insen domain-containing protein n=1 Tax=Schistosoma curassoni TaxID=6186 RepID=A0A183JFL4_9TREM|nr:unnamed protein product [Schistosoma curassoni]
MTRDNVDEATEEQLIQSFKTLGGDKGYITAQDIKDRLSASDAEYCLQNMPVLNGPTGDSGALDFESFAYSICGRKPTS